MIQGTSEVPDRIDAPVTIEEELGPGQWNARLPNGKIIFAYRSKRTPERAFAIGDQAMARLTVQDFSRGELVG